MKCGFHVDFMGLVMSVMRSCGKVTSGEVYDHDGWEMPSCIVDCDDRRLLAAGIKVLHAALR